MPLALRASMVAAGSPIAEASCMHRAFVEDDALETLRRWLEQMRARCAAQRNVLRLLPYATRP